KYVFFFFSSRRRHTRFSRDWSSDVCSSDLRLAIIGLAEAVPRQRRRRVKGQRLAGRTHGKGVAVLTGRGRTAFTGGSYEPPQQRSEERRVGKECRDWREACQIKENNSKSEN